MQEKQTKKKKATKPENLRVDKDKSNEQKCISEMLLITTRNHLCSWVKSTGISWATHSSMFPHIVS